MRFFALTLATFALSACSGDGRDGDVEPDAAERAKTVEAGGDGVAQAEDQGRSGARQVSLATELYSFAYSYPREAGSRQGLRMVLDRELEEAKTALIMQAREAKKEAEEEGFPFRPHSSATKWRVVAKPDGWLSLLAEIDTYSGGAHGMNNFDARLWNDAEKKSFETVELFRSPEALRKAIRAPFCKALNEEREERRGEPIAKDSDDPFDACIDPLAEAVLVPASSEGEVFDTIDIFVPPYAAGAYAEGSYEVEIPVTDAVRAALKPDYRAIFAKADSDD